MMAKSWWMVAALCSVVLMAAAGAEDNALTPQEREEGWVLLFDGKTLDGWVTNTMKTPKTPVEDGCLNPHKCGGYLLMHEKDWGNCVFAADFKISKECNSGIFFRVFPLKPRPKKSIAYNGIEMQILDSTTANMHDTGAIYDLVPPSKNTMKPVGEWNHAEILMRDNIVEISVNGEKVASMDCDEWPEAFKRPDGSEHKFPMALKDHYRHGYIGFQDHGHPVWFKNVKIRPLD